jgi:hypothetical protein
MVKRCMSMGALALVAFLVLVLSGTALATHPRPGGGTPFRTPLIPAYKECAAPNAVHTAPLTYGSCDPPELQSVMLTMTGNGSGSGSLRLDVFCTNAAVPPCTAVAGDQLDDRITFSQGDVRCAVGGVPGCSAPGADYTGKLLARVRIRLTDHSNPVVCSNGTGLPPCLPATMRDITFSAPAQCTDNGGAGGANCSVTTTFDSMEPNSVQEFQRQGVEILTAEAHDWGPDGVINANPADDPFGLGCPPICGNGDESLFVRTGIFNP